MSWTRRQLLKAGGVLAAVPSGGLLRPAWAAQEPRKSPAARRIALTNLHTGEHVDSEFWRDDAYVPEALAAIEGLLRDFRTGERHAIDPKLMDYLTAVAQELAVEAKFSVISGYRSPRTNEQLRAHSSEVSKRSLHMEGRAIDVRMAGIDCTDLAQRAQQLKRGGVGYYRASDFVHLDTGPFRTWRG